MNNINFTGLKNIGGYNGPLPTVPDPIRKCHLIVQLTDDTNGNDLTEYKRIINNAEPHIGNTKFIPEDEFVHIMTSVVDDGEDIPELAVNSKIIPPKTETMPLFTFIAKLTKRIAAQQNKDFNCDYLFLNNSESDRYVVPLLSISDIAEYIKLPKNIVKVAIYSPRMGRKVAQEINDNICQQMFDYLM
ncbi:MAG: hypothetical protein E7Z87_03545 [Cyanobacteria bacterium SIG26]|nr:hypothetical protein [Cyanobacteria bacterium SIG26]